MEEKDDLSINITINHKLSIEMIDDLMTTAFEGGINYWCKKVKIIDFPPNMNVNLTNLFASTLLANGGLVRLYDAESNDEWILNRPMIIKGIEMYCNKNSVTPEYMYDMHDADTADEIVQYAVFNELIFG